jgi:prepilin-type N-terminal cleavage/methylation domain-containing protein
MGLFEECPVSTASLSRESPAGASGYSLPEMLIVLVIICLCAAIAAPQIDFSKIRAKAAAQRLGTTLLALQREAITRQHNIVVVIDTANRRVRVVDDSTNDGIWNNNERVRSVEIGEGIRFTRPSGVTARPFGANGINFTTIEPTTGLPAIVFYRNGSAAEYGGVYISTPQAMAGASRSGIWALELTRATGRAEWYNWNGSGWKRGF